MARSSSESTKNGDSHKRKDAHMDIVAHMDNVAHMDIAARTDMTAYEAASANNGVLGSVVEKVILISGLRDEEDTAEVDTRAAASSRLTFSFFFFFFFHLRYWLVTRSNSGGLCESILRTIIKVRRTPICIGLDIHG
jgi:hypothetical protein